MSVVSRGVRNAFRNATRAIAIVVVLGLSLGLSFVMLVGHKSVQNKIDATLASVGTPSSSLSAGYAIGSPVNQYLTTAQLSKVASLRHVVNLDEVLLGSVGSAGTAGRAVAADRALRSTGDGEPVGFVGTTTSLRLRPTSAPRLSESWPGGRSTASAIRMTRW